MFTFTKTVFPDLTYLGAQIRCAQNRLTAVQTDLKYPLNDKSQLGWQLPKTL